MLGMESVPLLKPKSLTGFDGRHAPPIIHAIYLKLTIGLHSELTAFLLITDLGSHPIILGKSWMNRHGVILDMAYDKLIFKSFRCSHHGSISSKSVQARRLEAPGSDRRWDVSSWRRDAILPKASNAEHIATIGLRYTILPRSKPQPPALYVQDEIDSSDFELSAGSETERDNEPSAAEQEPSEVDTAAATKATSCKKRDLKKQRNKRWKVKKQQFELASPPGLDPDDSMNIAMIDAASFCLLVGSKGRKQGVQCFSITINQIDSALKALRADSESLEVAAMTKEILEHEQVKPILERIMEKVPKYFRHLSEVFDSQRAIKLSSHRLYDHKIELLSDSSALSRSRVYPLSELKLMKLKEYLEENLQKGFIVSSQVAYASSVLFAVKPNGQLRLCVDYRRLNHITKRNRYPIPLIEETLIRVQGCKYLIKLDIISAFNKLRMSEESEELITFVISMGSYKYRVLPFGLTNGLASWQHYMNDLLFSFLNDFCQVYLDDILIYSKFKKEHIVHVRKVLEKLKEAGLQVDIEKCEFFKKEVAFLGVMLSVDGLRMDPKKVEVIINWARSTNLKEVQAFVGFVNFYRRFIRDFFKKVRALTRMTKKLVGFEWTTEAEEAFNLLKKTVTEVFILRHYDRTKQAILETDSSDYVNAGVLSQYDDEGVLHPVAFYSRNMISVECNYEIYDKELLAIIRCLEHWRPELEGTEESVKIFTDHKGLEIFMTSKKLTSRQARWAETLSEFNIAIQFQSGAQNVKADALTRMPGSRPKDDTDERHQYREQVLLTPERLEIHAVESDEPIYERVLAANKADDDCKAYREALGQGLTSVDGVNLQDCRETDGVLYRGDRLWVPADAPLLVDLLREIHEPPASGHPGFNRMEDLLRRDYYWPNMRKAVRRYVRNCHGCQRTKASRDRKNGLLTPLVIPLQRWVDISIDFIIGLLDAHGHNVICTIIDRLSKERHYVLCTADDEGTSAEVTVKILINYVFRTHGLLFFITSDRGPQFISLVWQAFCRILGIKCKLFIAFHPETDGQTERANQDIERQLRQYCNYMQNDWDVWLPMAEFADNNAVFATTGLSPFFVNKGFHSRMSFSPDPISYATTRERLLAAKAEDIIGTMQNILNYVRDNVEVAQKRMIAQANKHRKAVEYAEGDFVFLDRRNIKIARPFDKLDDKKLGSFKVLQRMSNAYRLELSETMRIHDVFHCWLLRKDPRDSLEGQTNEPPGSVIVNENLEWEVDDILESRYHYNRLQYRANWSGWPHDRTWYYADNGEFDNARDVVDDYHRAHPIAAGPEPYKSIAAAAPEAATEEQDPPAGRRRSRRKAAALALIEATFG